MTLCFTCGELSKVIGNTDEDWRTGSTSSTRLGLTLPRIPPSLGQLRNIMALQGLEVIPCSRSSSEPKKRLIGLKFSHQTGSSSRIPQLI
ncbi:hypothetical protein FRC02_009243 [Tulasnella sp. 418]|nr:hypothetical protein FRC02_009243 [Tulasnella sp. 418]